MRVYELAKELGIESAALIETLHRQGIEVGSAAAGLSDDEIARVRDATATAHGASGSGEPDGSEEGASTAPASAEGEQPPASGSAARPGKKKGKPSQSKDKPSQSKQKPGKPGGYVLVGKGSVQLAGSGRPIIRRGERIPPAHWESLPERLKAHFEAAG